MGWIILGAIGSFVTVYVVVGHLRRQTDAMEKMAGITQPKIDWRPIGWVLFIGAAIFLAMLLTERDNPQRSIPGLQPYTAPISPYSP